MSDLSVSDYISLFALLIAALAFWETRKTNQNQNQLTSREIELVRIQISKAQQDAKHDQTAQVSARLVKKSKNSWCLRVFNLGPAEARNVRLVLSDDNKIIQDETGSGKFPMARMEKGQSVDVLARVFIGVPPKEEIELHWEDASANNRRNKIEITI
ncbi:MAG: hypothetical protein AAGA38_13540 [Pseudomonadota bacterium]